MKKLYYGIVGKNVYEEWIIPENTVDVKVITKGNGIFLQYVTEDEKKKKWASNVISNNLKSIQYSYFDKTLGLSFVKLTGGKYGFSKCSKNDKFDPIIGRAVAICHAMGRIVPDFI